MAGDRDARIDTLCKEAKNKKHGGEGFRERGREEVGGGVKAVGETVRKKPYVIVVRVC